MCLAIPMQILEINAHLARCRARGIERDVNLYMLQDESISIGDFVMVHVGYAIQKVDEQNALISHELYDQMMGQGSNGGA